MALQNNDDIQMVTEFPLKDKVLNKNSEDPSIDE